MRKTKGSAAAPNVPTLGAFSQGDIPTIACFNRATVSMGVSFAALIAAMQEYVDNHVSPHWGTPARLVQSTDFIKGAWAIVFMDDADVAGALAYHDLTPDGWPLGKIFVKTTLRYNELVSVSASHELAEMLADPAVNMMTTGPDYRAVYAYENADPVEALSFPVQGIEMSDFVYSSYFEIFRPAGSARFDHLGKVSRPFQILTGGYQIVFKNGRWSYVFADGDEAKKKKFQNEDRRGHRSEIRKEHNLLASTQV